MKPMSGSTITTDWNAPGRAQAIRQWRKQSAAMGAQLTEAIVEATQVEPGMVVLDLACGTGEPAISLASQLKGSGEVIGVDISTEPLKIAEERVAARVLANVTFQTADAHSLPFPDARFDRITSRLGVMFFADLPRAAREMHRVLKPKGTVTLLAWGSMEQPYFEATIGTLLRALPGARVPETAAKMFAFGRPDVLSRVLREAGFTAVNESFQTEPWTWPGTPDEVWAYFQEVTIPFAPLLKSIPAERREEVDAAVLRAISRYYDGREIKFTATVNITSGAK
jgi:ubiquinone/menaquinone biosynthesis C-methylase UbiE